MIRESPTMTSIIRRVIIAPPSHSRENGPFPNSQPRAARKGCGKPVLRKDDARLLVGDGCYSDDVNLAGQVYACFVRSPHAHARIRRVETDAALATPGVIAVLTGEDAAADEIKPITHSPMPGNPHEDRSEEHTSELQSLAYLVCRLLLEKKNLAGLDPEPAQL